MSKEVWGPKAWHLIHTFSIHSKDNECLYTMIQTFGYILPCEVCKKHYNYLINDIYYLNENKITQKMMIQYLIDIHNMINNDLDKKVKLSYKKAIQLQEKTQDDNILFLIKSIYKHLDYQHMSFNEFDKIYNFFVCFVKDYPTKKIRIKLNELINQKEFEDANTPMSFKKWFIKYYCTMTFVNNIKQDSFFDIKK